MKQRVIFLFYHGFGHVNALLKVASILEQNNYEVWFAGAGFFQNYVTTQGYKFYLLKSYPFGTGLEKWINTVEGKKNIYFRTLWDRITDRLFNERQADLYWMLEGIKPSLVFIDRMQSTDFLIMYPHLKKEATKIAIINTMLPTQISIDRPPLNSDALPTDAQAISSAIREVKWSKRIKKWKQKMMMFGFDDSYIISRRIEKNPILKRYFSLRSDLLNINLQKLNEFVLAPHEFDFPHASCEADQTYIGFLTADTRIETIEKTLSEKLETILRKKKEQHLRFVYCSFGTVPSKQRHTASIFFQKLAEISYNGEFMFLVSANSEEELEFIPSENFYVFKRVPQLSILKHADVFITHGGLNSIKEAVNAEVPMLVYPVHQEYDPRGNAARIFYHRLGLRGEIEADNAEQIAAKLRELITNNLYKENLRQLKDADGRYTSEVFIEAIMRISRLE